MPMVGDVCCPRCRPRMGMCRRRDRPLIITGIAEDVRVIVINVSAVAVLCAVFRYGTASRLALMPVVGVVLRPALSPIMGMCGCRSTVRNRNCRSWSGAAVHVKGQRQIAHCLCVKIAFRNGVAVAVSGVICSACQCSLTIFDSGKAVASRRQGKGQAACRCVLIIACRSRSYGSVNGCGGVSNGKGYFIKCTGVVCFLRIIVRAAIVLLVEHFQRIAAIGKPCGDCNINLTAFVCGLCYSAVMCRSTGAVHNHYGEIFIFPCGRPGIVQRDCTSGGVLLRRFLLRQNCGCCLSTSISIPMWW